MKILPVDFVLKPGYPELQEFLRSPSSITQYAPERWQSNKVILTALISLAMSNQSCENFTPKTTRYEIIQLYGKNNYPVRLKEFQMDSSFVAPLFQHGEGIGVYGCVVIMPPVFINEQDAKQIIMNELKKEGLNFDSISHPEQKVIISTHKKIWEETNDDYTVRDTTEENELYADGYNKELNFAFYFVSQKNFRQFTDFKEDFSSVSEDEYKKTSEKLRKAIKEANSFNAVVFYEPIPYPGFKNHSELPDWDEWEIKGKELAVDSLKAQVADFVEWFKNEKISMKK